MTITISGSDAGFAILGGILIALSTSAHLWLKGRITGMSGIFFALITLEKKSLPWRVSLVSGMIIMTCIFYAAYKYGPII